MISTSNAYRIHERRVAGGMLQDTAERVRALDFLGPHMFADKLARDVFQVIAELHRSGAPVNVEAVVDLLAAEYQPADIKDLLRSNPTNTGRYSLLVAEGHMRREGAKIGITIACRMEEGDDVFEVLKFGQDRLATIQDWQRTDTHVRHAVGEARERIKDWEARRRTDAVPTGIYSLDSQIGGFPRSEVTFVGGQTGGGKSALMVQLGLYYGLRSASPQFPPAVIFSAEMTREQLVHRAASNLSRVPLSDVQSGSAARSQYGRFSSALDRIELFPLHVDSTPSPSLHHISNVLTRIAHEDGGLGLVLIDYDEKVDAGEKKSEELRVSAIAQGLKRIAKDHGVPIVVFSQYSRIDRPDLPQDWWFRYSGKKEQEGFLLMHIHWPYWWHRKGFQNIKVPDGGQWDDDTCYLIVTKNRQGKTGHFRLRYCPDEHRFEDPHDPEFHDSGTQDRSAPDRLPVLTQDGSQRGF